ncbi:butyrophilin-like protein 9 [Garra rufa]|uniref:butyrophilin-like protein 9 n=1 Tax=Garra rufa TaxID=137080 RepID=UPI003CCEED85
MLVSKNHITERLLVSGSDESISASIREDITLNCSVDSHITPEHFEEVSWKKTDEDDYILVLLYQNNKTLSDSSGERYRDRAEFFTGEIPKGNFSLRLKSVRTEDKGVYMCQVFAGGLSANATAELKRLGFSVLHIMVLILCISASGSALLLCCLIYCRSHNNVPTATKHIRTLGFLHALLPNIIMFVASFIWGFIEDTVS